ncbi:rhombosortase [Vibrio sp. PNB22_3_1]
MRTYHDHLFVLILSFTLIGITEYVNLELVLWDRSAILSDGQWWRVLTAHFAHINEPHLFANLISLTITFYALRLNISEVIVCATTLSISISALLFFTNAQEYAGFSGVIHGLITYAAMQQSLNGEKLGPIILYALIGKLTYELYVDIKEPATLLLDLNPSSASHVIGAFIGVILGSDDHEKSTPSSENKPLNDTDTDTDTENKY